MHPDPPPVADEFADILRKWIAGLDELGATHSCDVDALEDIRYERIRADAALARHFDSARAAGAPACERSGTRDGHVEEGGERSAE